MSKISRKFLVKKIPDISKLFKIHYERYFLSLEEKSQIRIQAKNDSYELEEVNEKTEVERSIQKRNLTKEEFEELKQKAIAAIKRDSYLFSEKPLISIKIYHDQFEGLIRAEVDFSSLEEAENFKHLDWFGKEITDSPLGKDRKLLALSENEFETLIKGN